MKNEKKQQSFAAAVKSALQAFIGIQKRENLEQDFKQQSPLPFLVAGLLMATAFVTTLIIIVNVVLSR
jgi:diacylglycerol kinase